MSQQDERYTAFNADDFEYYSTFRVKPGHFANANLCIWGAALINNWTKAWNCWAICFLCSAICFSAICFLSDHLHPAYTDQQRRQFPYQKCFIKNQNNWTKKIALCKVPIKTAEQLIDLLWPKGSKPASSVGVPMVRKWFEKPFDPTKWMEEYTNKVKSMCSVLCSRNVSRTN